MRARLVEAGTIVERVVTNDQLRRAELVAVIDDVCGWRLIDLAG